MIPFYAFSIDRKVKNDMIDDMPAMQRDIERQCCEQSVSTSLKSKTKISSFRSLVCYNACMH